MASISSNSVFMQYFIAQRSFFRTIYDVSRCFSLTTMWRSN